MMQFEPSSQSVAMKRYVSIPEVLLRLNESQAALAELISICTELCRRSRDFPSSERYKNCFSLVHIIH